MKIFCPLNFLFIIFISSFFLSCGNDSIENNNVELILSSDTLNYKEYKQEIPSDINLYIDVSSSMKNYLGQKLTNEKNLVLFENFIRNVFNYKQSAVINLYGFGDSVYFIGKNREFIPDLLEFSTYKEKSSRIDLVLEKIKADSSAAINFVISDAIYENGANNNNDDIFILSDYLTKYIASNNLVGLIANKFGYFSTTLNKVSSVPLYMFVFGRYNYLNYLVKNYLKTGQDVFLISPENNFKTSYSLSDNLEVISPSGKYSVLEVNNYDKPVVIDLNFDREIIHKDLMKLIAGDNYNINVYEKNLNDKFEADKEWKSSSINDPKITMLSKFGKDSTKQTFTLKFEKNIKEKDTYTIYKIALSSNLPKWIQDKYSSNDPGELEKTYRFSDLFSNLQNRLSSNPVPLFTYYIIIK